MIKKVFSLVVVAGLSSCISNPIKYYPPKHGTSNSAQRSQTVKPPVAPTPSAVPQQPVSSQPVATQPPPPTAPVVTPVVTTSPPQAATTTSEVPAVEVKRETKDVLFNFINTPQVSRPKVLALIEAANDLSQLEYALDKSTSTPFLQSLKPNLLLRAGEVAQTTKRPDKAIEYYRALVSQFPTFPQTAIANSEIALLEAGQKVNPKVIGAVLPLSGKNANIGQHALNSIRIALGLNKPDPKFQLALFDSQGLPEMAKAGVEKLIRDDKAIAIIGGLSSKEATSIAQRAESLNVPLIGLSQKSGLTDIGNYVFRNSLTPEMQVDRLVQYAFEKLSAKRFAILYPNDAYGVEFANAFWDLVLARGGQVTAAQTFDPKANDFTEIVKRLVGTYHVDARSDEYKTRMKELAEQRKEKAEKNKTKNSRVHDVEENVLPPIVDFDVLFIPDTGKTLGQVMAFMKVNDVPPITYLGTNIWNSPDLSKRAGLQTNAVYFVDALEMNDQTIRETDFFKNYVAEYGEEPTLIEMQTFEAAKILRDTISSGAATREALANELRGLGRSAGVTGELRMSNHRELERPLKIFSLDQGQIKKVE